MKTGRPQTQTALVVANGKTQVALDVEIGAKRRRVLRAEDGTIIRPEGSAATAAQRTRRVNHNQGDLFG